MEAEKRSNKRSALVPRAFQALNVNKDRRMSELRGFLLSFLAIIIGIALIQITDSHDFGIGEGLVASGFVTLIYESHSRAQKDRETMGGILRLVYNDIVADGFWEEIEAEILNRKFIRKNAAIEIDFKEDAELPGKLCIHLRFSYEVYALRPVPTTANLIHRLNFHIEDERQSLPRFEMIRIGDSYARSRADLTEFSRTKKPFQHHVSLKPKNKDEGTDVRVTREELVYLPGTYNFVLAELTSGITISSDSIPDGIKVKVALRPGKPEEVLRPSTVPIRDKKLFLPGSCIEFRLEREKM